MTFPEVFAENSSEESYKCKINILKDSPNTSISILIKSSTKSPQAQGVVYIIMSIKWEYLRTSYDFFLK